ncbi:MAG: hypothetical protein PSV17_05485 [Methylotenera sp.]|uniref:hypothetical protein n=1 Tax=Methylotenera sp. TaxID=2051956 RepID=UPI0024897005|nr:hypothetical protein [Methylotenera sp.]MDI1308869.1 hypothetical protein [Methylotenera sp.]
MRELVTVAHVPSDSINEGFITAANTIGLSVVLLTDCAQLHREHFTQSDLASC